MKANVRADKCLLHHYRRRIMKLKECLVLSALLAGANAWAADTPAAKPAEGASASVHKAEVKCEEDGNGG